MIGQAGGFPVTHETYRYPALVELYAKGLVADGFPVRWLPDLAAGYGYPTFVYYPQGIFALATGWKLAFGIPAVVALSLATWTCLAAGAFGMFFAGRRLSGSDAGGWMSALMWLFAPWLAVDVVVRGDLAEASALALGGLTLAAAVSLAGEAKGVPHPLGRVFGAIAFALPIIFHPMGGVMVDAVAGAVGIAVWLGRPRATRTLSGLTIAMAGGFAMCAWSVLPLVTLDQFVQLDNASMGYYKAQNHVVSLWQLVSGPWGYGGSNIGNDDEMSFVVGWPLLIAAVLGARAARRPPYWMALLLTIAGSLLMSRTFTFLWTETSLLHQLQFPGRLVGLVTMAAAVAAGGCAAIAPPRRRWVFAVLLVTSLFVQYVRHYPHFNLKTYAEAQKTVDETVASLTTIDERYAGMNEFAPVGSGSLPPRANTPVVPMVMVGGAAVPSRVSGNTIRFATDRANGADVRIAQFNFPGWEASVDGARLDREDGDRHVDGTVRIQLPPGPPANVVVRYAGPKQDRWLLGLAAATPFVIFLWSFLNARRRPASALETPAPPE
jgi:hypothetical protein